MTARVIIVGAGISGLAAAWKVVDDSSERDGIHPEVIVLEAAAEVGGKARTLQRGPWMFEAGPTGFLSGEPALDELVRHAGLTALPAKAASARRFLVRGGQLREVHAKPFKFLTSGLLGPLGILRMALEPFLPACEADLEESIYDFARRRLGRQAAERLVSPMVLGVFAGDARKLSLPAAFPRMRELECQYKSLFRALARLKLARRESGGPAGPAGVLTSFEGGLASLPRALATRAPFEVRTSARVESVAAADFGAPWRLRLAGAGEAIEADAVILAGEARSSAALLEDLQPAVAADLAGIDSPPVAVVALGFGPQALKKVPRGFGALIARSEGFRSMGVLFDSFLFPGRAPEDHLLVRCMVGGATDPKALELDEEQLIGAVREDLARLLGLQETPLFHEVVRWPRAIPQYELGHLARVARIDAAMDAMRATRPGLHLAGNYRHGVAFGKAAAQGREAGKQVVRHLAANDQRR